MACAKNTKLGKVPAQFLVRYRKYLHQCWNVSWVTSQKGAIHTDRFISWGYRCINLWVTGMRTKSNKVCTKMYSTAAVMNPIACTTMKELDRRRGVAITKGEEKCLFTPWNPTPWNPTPCLSPGIFHICPKHIACS